MAQRSKRRRQVVLGFDERPDLRSSSLRGGKGASLADMRALCLPVPPGFTIVTTVARAVMEHGTFPNRLERQLQWGIEKLERDTGKKFGDAQNPLFVSVRSGADQSMPGMMETILNLGMNENTCAAMRSLDAEFANTSWARFCDMYSKTVLELQGASFDASMIPSDPQEQLRQSIAAVIRSWNAPRAVAYRERNGIPHNLGTAVTVQAMVFGNRDKYSGTGVVFSRNPNTGERGMYGECLPGAQGEALVSGERTPIPLSKLRAWNEGLYLELQSYMPILEEHFRSVVDVEFTIESGVLWLLQCRKAKLSSEAKATFAVHQVWDKKWTKQEATSALSAEEVASLEHVPTFAEDLDDCTTVAEGINASQGAASGHIAFSSEEAIAMKAKGMKVVLVRPSTDPSDLQGMLASDAIVTYNGGATCHAAIVARQLRIPAVVGVSSHNSPIRRMQSGELISVCGNTGRVFAGVLQCASKPTKKEVNLFLRWMRAFPNPTIDFNAASRREKVNAILMEVYLLEAMMVAAKGTALEKEVSQLRYQTLIATAEFFVAYLAVAVVGELRYAYSGQYMSSPKAEAAKGQLRERFGVDGSQNRGDERILSVLKALRHEDCVAYFTLAAEVFGVAGWSAAFGGPKWAAIAQAGADFLSGKLDHALFVDHVFDLRHNGGVLFNKHPMVYERTDEVGVREQLDCKRYESDLGLLYAGLEYHAGKTNLSSEFTKLWARGKSLKLWQKKERAHV